MQIKLSPEIEKMLRDVMLEGGYDAETAIASGLANWRRDQSHIDDWWAGLGSDGQRKFVESLDTAIDGPTIEPTPEYFESLRVRARDRAAQRQTA